MKLTLHEFDLPLRHPFTIARSSHSVQKTLIVELEQDGLHGYGEATTNEYYGATLVSMTESVESVRSELESHDLNDPAALWEQLNSRLKGHSFAQCALDGAAYDLWGKMLGRPVYALLGFTVDHLPTSNFTIAIDELDVMAAKLKEAPGWPVYKIKLGTAEDLEIVRRLRQLTAAPFRVDANCGWQVDETILNAHELKAFGVEFVEQPLPADDWDGARRVYSESELPVIADESCQVETDVDRCHEHFHGVNIKLVKCGGITPALRMIARAKQLGMKVMVGCMTESTVGISAIGHLLPLLDYVDMDGASLLRQDIAIGVTVDRGVCQFANENGLGITLLTGPRTVSEP